ncbi:MAG: GntR family transcriptional regulator [Anaerolineaceae bacterium]|nr:GntR family transcriptional regulator [Anaerolineaceae bacterium]
MYVQVCTDKICRINFLMNKVTDISLADDSFISLHVQLHNQLRQLIHSGRWANATRIPSENELTSHLNISRSTVRLALQQAELEGLIERIAGRGTFVAYVPTHGHKSRLIAFVTGGIDAENHLLMLNGAEQEVRTQGYQLVFKTAKNQEEELRIFDCAEQDDLAGFLLWPNANSTQEATSDVARYQNVPAPIVLMDRKIAGLNCDCVTSDNYGGARALMQHLVGLGHKQIIFMTHEILEIFPVMERYRAYCEVLEEAGIPTLEPWIIGQPNTEIGASYALQSSLDPQSLEIQQIKRYMTSNKQRPTAIFALNDWLALLGMRAMKQLNLKVPDAISIAGFDDIDLAVHLEVPLTTVAQNPFLIGKRAAQLLLDRLENNTDSARLDFIPTELRIRSSTSRI